jgi:uncharacterized protein (TIGR02145 family)
MSMPDKLDIQGIDILGSSLSLLRDPSLRASAQDDSNNFDTERGKNGGFAAILSSPFPLYCECHPERSEGSRLKALHLNNIYSAKYKKNKHMKTSTPFLLTLATLFAFSCGSHSSTNQTSTSEEHGDSIKAVVIGKQIWMAENLNVNEFQNGDTLYYVRLVAEWRKAALERIPAYCYANFDSANEKIFGKLYNWFAVGDSRGLCPEGWHVPTDTEHQILRYILGDSGGDKLKSEDTAFWKQTSREVIDQTGFGGLPGGAINFEGEFLKVGTNGFWWSSTESDDSHPNAAYYLGLFDDYPEIGHRVYDKSLGFSVRCVLDE